MNLRKLIVDEMEQVRLTPAELLRRLKGRVKKQTLYDYLGGKSDTGGEAIGHILEELELLVVKKEQAEIALSVAEVVNNHLNTILKPVVHQIPLLIAGEFRRKVEGHELKPIRLKPI